MRCAIYARYSSDLQRESSIEDQIRKCREHAERLNWTVLEDYVRYDRAISGASVAGRYALEWLVSEAKKKLRPFDRLLVDDTSRLARSVPDALNLIDRLQFQGVSVVAVSQGIDSQQKSARTLLTVHSMMDEQYLIDLAHKVHRGQEGRARLGLNPGGRCYGYINVPIEDPSRKGKYGRPAVMGVDLEIHQEEAAVVRRIFKMYADGLGLGAIAKRLNQEGVPAPQPPRTRPLRAWCPSSIHEMLRNERYRGVQVWGRTKKERNPDTGKKVSRQRPPSDWVRVEAPKWRVVSQELWNAVHHRIAQKNRIGAARCGGMSRTEKSRTYLFSGLLRCGVCGSNMVIVSGQGRRGYVKYGCPSHRYRGICSNKLTIRRDRLEGQLLAAIETRALTPEMMDYTLSRFQQELQKRLANIQKQGKGLSALHKERSELQAKAKRVTEAIAEAGHSPALLAQLSSIESELAHVERRIDARKPVDLNVTVAEMRDFVSQKMSQLRDLLRNDPGTLKGALMKHVPQLVLTPVETPTGPVFDVTGGVELVGRGDDVMPLVARDGIEPPTPAFSGLRDQSLTDTFLVVS